MSYRGFCISIVPVDGKDTSPPPINTASSQHSSSHACCCTYVAADETTKSIRFERLDVDTGDGVDVGNVDLDGTEVVGRKDAVRPAALARDVQIHVHTVGVLHISKETVW